LEQIAKNKNKNKKLEKIIIIIKIPQILTIPTSDMLY